MKSVQINLMLDMEKFGLIQKQEKSKVDPAILDALTAVIYETNHAQVKTSSFTNLLDAV